MGAFPVFVMDGEPSPLKSQARAVRFFRGFGLDLSALPSTEADARSSAAAAPVKGRNAAFTRSVEECVVSCVPLLKKGLHFCKRLTAHLAPMSWKQPLA
jgi:hypothetical protein